MYTQAVILLDSICETTGSRITTFWLKFPRIVNAEILRHRLFSLGSASSRAIPNSRLYESIKKEGFIPSEWVKNQRGMYGTELIEHNVLADYIWEEAMGYALEKSTKLAGLGVHKQYCNRLLEPFQYIELILTATCFDNFFNLRIAPDAQPEISELAEAMLSALQNSTPDVLEPGDWHIPYLDCESELSLRDLAMVGAARCARVSYKTFDGNVSTPVKDLELANKLLESGHMSPFEHVAVALPEPVMVGNLIGYASMRKIIRQGDIGQYTRIISDHDLLTYLEENQIATEIRD
jgi:thymidylate synthase ThyX